RRCLWELARSRLAQIALIWRKETDDEEQIIQVGSINGKEIFVIFRHSNQCGRDCIWPNGGHLKCSGEAGQLGKTGSYDYRARSRISSICTIQETNNQKKTSIIIEIGPVVVLACLSQGR